MEIRHVGGDIVTSGIAIQAIVVSDGKPGHYNQSLGVIQGIPKCTYRWLQPRFRSKQHDNLLRLLVCLFGRLSFPQWFIKRLLRMVLRSDTMAEILKIDRADVVLSTGSSVAAINLLLGRLLCARTVTCRRPSPIGTVYFDLALLPKVNWPRREKRNVVKILGIPNVIAPEKLDGRRNQLEIDLKLPKCVRIGVLIGGEDRYHRITEQTAIGLINVLQRVALALKGQILLTTSRRTPPMIAELISNQLSDVKICPILAVAGRKASIGHPTEAIIALSDLILVTQDSFSMVCEAASSGRRVVILETDWKRPPCPKQDRAYAEIMRRASVDSCRIDGLEARIQCGLSDCTPIAPLRDTEVAVEAVVRLLS